LFPLLQGKRYDEADPYLKRFLSEDKNNEHANANLQMGFIYQFKSERADILSQTKDLLMFADSARYYYTVADKLIDEKEIKRNADFYDAYNRRDLRTGKYGISLSDVRFDIENRIKALQDRSDKISTLGFHFQRSKANYALTLQFFEDVRTKYPSRTKLLLQGNGQLLEMLSDIRMYYDSSMYHFNRYRSVLETIEKPGYNQSMDIRDLHSFEEVESTMPDFTRSLIPILDYRRWSASVEETVTKDVVPMRQQIITYDIELNKLYKKLESDSVSVRSELTKLVDQLLSSQLRKLDPNPLPMAIFGFKQEELDYHSFLIETRALADSADIYLQITTAEKRRDRALAMDSAMQVLAKFDLSGSIPNYETFIASQFENEKNLRSFIAGKIEFTQREKIARTKQTEYLSQRKDWIFTNTGDSLSIMPEYRPRGNESQFAIPLVVLPEILSIGLNYQIGQTAKGYLATFGRSRKVRHYHTFQVNAETFSPEFVDYFESKQTLLEDGESIGIVIFNKSADAVVGHILKIHMEKGVIWNTEFKTLAMPEALTEQVGTGGLAVKCRGKEGEEVVITVDTKGKITSK
jgi:hypothetical protein